MASKSNKSVRFAASQEHETLASTYTAPEDANQGSTSPVNGEQENHSSDKGEKEENSPWETAIRSLESDSMEEKLVGLFIVTRFVIPTERTGALQGEEKRQLIRLFHATTPQFLQELLLPFETGVRGGTGSLSSEHLTNVALLCIGFFAQEADLVPHLCDLLPDLVETSRVLKDALTEHSSHDQEQLETLMNLACVCTDVCSQFSQHGTDFQDFPWGVLTQFATNTAQVFATTCSTESPFPNEKKQELQSSLEEQLRKLQQLFAIAYEGNDMDAFDIMTPSALANLFEILGMRYSVAPQRTLESVLQSCISWCQLSPYPVNKLTRSEPYYTHAVPLVRKVIQNFLQSRLPDGLRQKILHLVAGLTQLFSAKWMVAQIKELSVQDTTGGSSRENGGGGVASNIKFLLLVIRLSGIELKVSLDSVESYLVQSSEEGGVTGSDVSEEMEKSSTTKIIEEREMTSIASGRYSGNFGESGASHVPEDLRPPKSVPYKTVAPLTREQRAKKVFEEYEAISMTVVCCGTILEHAMSLVSRYASVEPSNGSGWQDCLSGLDYETIGSLKSSFHSPLEVCHAFLQAIQESELYNDIVFDPDSGVPTSAQVDVSNAVWASWEDSSALTLRSCRSSAVALLCSSLSKFICTFAYEDTEAYAVEVGEIVDILMRQKAVSLDSVVETEGLHMTQRIRLASMLPMISGCGITALDVPVINFFSVATSRLHQESFRTSFQYSKGDVICLNWLSDWSRAVAVGIMDVQSREEGSNQGLPQALSSWSLDSSSTAIQLLIMLNEYYSVSKKEAQGNPLDRQHFHRVVSALQRVDDRVKTHAKYLYRSDNSHDIFLAFVHWTHNLACLLCDVFDLDCQFEWSARQLFDKATSLRVLRSIGTATACPLWKLNMNHSQDFPDETYSRLWESLVDRIRRLCQQNSKYSQSFRSLFKEPLHRSVGSKLEEYIRLVAAENNSDAVKLDRNGSIMDWIRKQLSSLGLESATQMDIHIEVERLDSLISSLESVLKR
eukprot:gb/GECG01010546.1/.p1 GENE.gb/GECG01010546.1/~~gb/GECG01010546.1/.p1  ORF type:complete len:1010 (+),score=115.64 gb/GECG01010546.1/:1-3030(+)